MDRTFLAASTLAVLSLVGYVTGVVAPYPGREASLVGLMVGVTLVAVTYGRGGDTVTGGTVGRSDGAERADGSGRTAATDATTADPTGATAGEGERR